MEGPLRRKDADLRVQMSQLHFNNNNQTEINHDLIKNNQFSGRSFITNPSKLNQMEKTDNKINNLIQDMRKPQPK